MTSGVRREDGDVAINAVPEKTETGGADSNGTAAPDWICGADTEGCEAGRASFKVSTACAELERLSRLHLNKLVVEPVDVGGTFA